MNSNENNTNLNQNNISNNVSSPTINNLQNTNQNQPSVVSTNQQAPVQNPVNSEVNSVNQSPVNNTVPMQNVTQQTQIPTGTISNVEPTNQTVQNQNIVNTVSEATPQVQTTPVNNTPVTPSVATVTTTPVTPTVTAQNESNEIVVNTTKKKTSNVILVILIFLMVLFVFNIDTVIEMYNNYVNNGTLTNNNSTTDNLANGFIMIDEASYMNLKEIRFYNFKKKEDSVAVTFNYEANQIYDDASTLKIYIELYNADKEIIYKELFNPGEPLEKGTIRTYTLSLTNDVYTSAFYALAKIYTQEEENSTSTLVCKFNDDNENVTVNYEITYNFKNNGLINYSVNKNYQLKGANTDNYVTELETEYNSVKDIIPSVVYENNTLQYKIEFDTEIENFTPIYNKDTIINVIKQKETLKKWNCE